MTEHRLRPPYTTLEPLVGESARGDLLVLADPDPGRLYADALELRRAHPQCALVLQLSGNIEANLPLIRTGALAGVRAVMRATEHWPEVLRQRLTEYGPQGRVVVEWIHFHQGRLDSRVAVTLSRILDGVGKSAQVSASESRCLNRAGLPSPKAWRSFRRAIEAARIIQKDDGFTFAAAAVEAGYCDQPAMNRAIRRLFSCSPKDLRHRMGIDWMIAAFLSAAKLSRPAASHASSIKKVDMAMCMLGRRGENQSSGA